MSDWDVVIRDAASDADVAALRNALFEFNFATTGYRDGRSLSCFLYDGDDLVAGIDGFTWGGYARIDILWVAESQRGRGLGDFVKRAGPRVKIDLALFVELPQAVMELANGQRGGGRVKAPLSLPGRLAVVALIALGLFCATSAEAQPTNPVPQPLRADLPTAAEPERHAR